MMTTMKAWQCRPGPGPVEERLFLATQGIPKPTITDTQVLVETYSAALNPIEHKILELGLAKKLMFRAPVTVGMDVCGRIAEVGKNVDSFRVGDVVFGACDGVFGGGSIAEFVAVSKDTIALVPEGADAESMASIAVVGMTTYQALQPHVKKNCRVFINGGSGGTGVLSIQIAKALGCYVTTSCSTANIELCKSLGADEVLDYKSEDIIKQLRSKGHAFDLILDNIGTPANLYRASPSFLEPNGKFLQVGLGMSLAAMRQLVGNLLIPGFLGGGKGKYIVVMAKGNTACFEQLARWVQEGKLRAVLDSTFEFDDVPKAFERLKTGRSRGKVVVRVKKL
ncbi:reticulon-4-interacting protein 1, mitochondrial precursor [Cadophora sp. MPI-SDFR-AT-0126]|nr:reticulon-4-interacting protein 1, mitochondrial precursor [Leotiomycetes sp. MPI-SDFR-AT-0126]